MKEIPPEKLDRGILTAGYLSVDELVSLTDSLGFEPSTAEECRVPEKYFRSGVEVYDDHTFTQLRIVGRADEDEDCVALYIGKNLFIVVDVEDSDRSTKTMFEAALKRAAPVNAALDRVISFFLDQLISDDIKLMEEVGTRLESAEESLLEEDVDKSFSAGLFAEKKQLLRLHNYYEQILDITQALSENENGVFDTDDSIYIGNITKKAERLREDADSLKSSVEHLQEAYSSFLDSKMNSTMKVFTVLTSIFFPLTIIVGWYGMNFQSMPEFTWKYGYVFVISLSVVTVLTLFAIGKRKKWF